MSGDWAKWFASHLNRMEALRSPREQGCQQQGRRLTGLVTAAVWLERSTPERRKWGWEEEGLPDLECHVQQTSSVCQSMVGSLLGLCIVSGTHWLCLMAPQGTVLELGCGETYPEQDSRGLAF